jgi:predicted secreted protein
MTTSAFWAYGSTIQLGDAATPEVFTSIAEITELAFLEMSRDKIDVTSHSSADGYREKMPGLRDAGKISVKANWLPNNATHDETTGILAKFNDNVLHNWKIIAPSTLVTAAFAGYVSDFKADLPLEEQGQLEFAIEISGKPTVS